VLVPRFTLLWLLVLGPAILACAESPAVAKTPPARTYSQACAHPDNPGLDASITRAAYDQQLQSLAPPGRALPDDPDLRRALCEIALWRLDAGSAALSPSLPRASESKPDQPAEGANQDRIGRLEDDLRQVRNSLRNSPPPGSGRSEPGELWIVAIVAAIALCLSIASMFIAVFTTRRALRDAGLL
jgi:hypothetical protein